jgi:hypothetical protein
VVILEPGVGMQFVLDCLVQRGPSGQQQGSVLLRLLPPSPSRCSEPIDLFPGTRKVHIRSKRYGLGSGILTLRSWTGDVVHREIQARCHADLLQDILKLMLGFFLPPDLARAVA